MTDNKKKVSPYWLALEYSAILLFIIIPISVQAGLFFGNKTLNADTQVKSETVLASDSALSTPLLAALQNPNPQGARGGAEVLVNDGALVTSGPVGADVIATTKNSSGEISVYTVRQNDTLSHVAEMYGVTVNTILWANDLTKASSIKEGQTLIILPVAGVRHTVKSGDTVKAIAKKYEADEDEIISYNQLVAGEALAVGSVIVVPGGEIHTAPVIAKSAPVKTSGSNSALGSWLNHPAPGAVRTQGLHGYNAVDLAGAAGSAIKAAASGEVIVSKSSGWNGGYGLYVVVKHANGAQTLYAHLSRVDVGVGAYVKQGQVIGAMGNTGKSTGTHLHFEVRGGSNPF